MIQEIGQAQENINGSSDMVALKMSINSPILFHAKSET